MILVNLIACSVQSSCSPNKSVTLSGENDCAMPQERKSLRSRQAQESPPGTERRFKQTLPWIPGPVAPGRYCQVMQLLRISRSRGLLCKRIAHAEQKRTLADCLIHIMKNISFFRDSNGFSVGKTSTLLRSE